MTELDLDSDTHREHDPTASATRATVFGLDVQADVELSFLGATSSQPAPPSSSTRQLSISVGERPDQLDWPSRARVISEQVEPDGTASFRIESHPEAGYLIWGEAYGRHQLSADGQRALCLPGDLAPEAWQRLLIAQVLPFAALLQGLEVFHASAVARDGEAIAFVGPSGAGKTSIALELCRLGASFLTDDVLALAREDGRLLAYPGTPVAGLDHAEARRLDAADIDAYDMLGSNSRERLLRVSDVSEPAPLGAMFFLDRRPEAEAGPRFEPVRDPQLLLAATFNFVLATPARLLGLLDICSLAAARRVERVSFGADVDASRLAEAIERRLDSSP